MKYLALAALAATFWLLVATAHLLVSDDSRPPRPRTSHCMMVSPRFDQMPEPEPLLRSAHNPLRRVAVVSGMNAVKPEISRCYQAYGVPGMALVNVAIAPDGLVSSARVTGRFAGTPTGTCVEQAVLTARFPPSDGLATPYPFQLR
jgi:hypothetical protein